VSYYRGIAADCAQWDVPMGTTEELLGLPRPRLRHAGDRATASMRSALRL